MQVSVVGISSFVLWQVVQSMPFCAWKSAILSAAKTEPLARNIIAAAVRRKEVFEVMVLSGRVRRLQLQPATQIRSE